MTKSAEKKYFDKIGKAGVSFTLRKPYADRQSVGCLMNNIGAIASILRNTFGLKDLNIIDLGCGSGWTSNQFAMMGHSVLGVDISKTAIEAARATFNLPNLEYLATDYDKLAKTHEKRFDVAVFHDSLHHSDDPSETLRMAMYTLRKGGICVVCEPGKGHAKSPDALEAVERYGVTEADLPPSKIVQFAKRAGFTIYKIYSSPSLLHRVLYWEYDGKLSILKVGIFRLAAVILTVILKKQKEGLVVLYC